MQCPYCKAEMKQGYVASAYPFFWKSEKNPTSPDTERIKLSRGLWNGCTAQADYCPSCKKVILSIDP